MDARRTRSLSIYLIAAFAAVLAGVGYLYILHRDSLETKPITSYAEEGEVWVEEIGMSGGRAAYDRMVRRYAGIPESEAHEYAHVFGAKLFKTEGVGGLGACGSAYGWGCYHSHIDRSISSLGLAVLDPLNDVCESLPKADIQQCQHGLGHGILSYLGTEKLFDALQYCENIADPMYGCVSGVFMDLLNGNMHDKRPPLPYTDSARFWPCTEVGETFKAVCYRRLPQWWWSAVIESSEEPPRTLEQYCRAVPEKPFQNACFLGVGYFYALKSQLDAEATRIECAQLEHSTDRQSCMYGAALSLFQNAADRAEALCPDNNELQECIRRAERILGVSEDSLTFPDE